MYPNTKKPLKVGMTNVTSMFYYKTIYSFINVVYGWLKDELDNIDQIRCEMG